MSKQQNIPPNVLFFSKKCKTSSLFITMCQQNKVLKYFQMIDVDDKIKELSEKGLKVVPTIIIKGLTKPIEGKNVFNWLESIMSMNSNKQIDNSNEQFLPETGINQTVQRPSSGSGTTNPNNNIVKRNIAPPPIIPSKQELKNKQEKMPDTKIVNGVEIKNAPVVKSQPFGFLQEEMAGFSDSFAYLMSDNPLPKAFLPCDKDLEIYTAPEGDKLDKRNQEMLMKNVEMIRENDKTHFVKHMETEHKKALLEENNKKR
jgi:hypothetical protein